MTDNPHALTQAERQSWAAWGHSVILDGVFRARNWEKAELTFQGGTALNLVHGSPRFSEDLDFLLDPKRHPDAVMRAAIRFIEHQALIDFGGEAPAIELHAGDGTQSGRKNPLTYEVRLTPARKKTKVRVKVKFYSPPAETLPAYDKTVARTMTPVLPSFSVRIRPVTVTTGTLPAIFRDKVVALATRGHLAARDVFDLWWIYTTLPPERRGVPELLDGLCTHFAMYPNAPGKSHADMLRQRVDEIGMPEVRSTLEAAIPQWMDVHQSRLFNDHAVIDDMLAFARKVAGAAAGRLAGNAHCTETAVAFSGKEP